jgi:cephalosporin-C deacetylase-like acetyl esterase
MVNRRAFLMGNLTAVAQSAFGSPWAASPLMSGGTGEEEQIPRSRRDFWNDWPNFITKSMNQAGASRKALLARIQSKQQIMDRSGTVRAQLWEILGGRPEETPLNARTVGAIDRSGYRIEKLIFESMPEVYVTANLYLPTAGKPPYPGILAPLGHTSNGKAYRNYQYSYQNLARKGYVVLAYDPFGQGERCQYLLPGTSRPRYSATGEHIQAGRPMILFGSGFARYRVWDGIRSLDYLLSRFEVDPQRIGCAGHSGGATMTMYLMALEPRIQAAVAVEGNFENMAGPYYDPPGAIADAEQNIVGSLPLGLDRGDLLAAFAPKPLLMCYTVNDEGQTYSPLYEEATKETYDELLRVYGILGARNKLELFTGHLPHDLDFFQRRAMYGWFNRWFEKMDAGLEEADFDASPDATLNCTTTGQVLTSLGGRSIVQLNRDRAKELLPSSLFLIQGGDPSSAREQVRAQLAKLLILPSQRTPLNDHTLSSDMGRKLRIEEIQYEPEVGVRITGWFVRPKEGASARPTVLYISDGLADQVVAEPSLFDEIFNHGNAICAINMRGMGLSTPRPPSGGPVFYKGGMQLKDRIAWTNLVLGRPVIGQRVWDILRTLDYLESRSDVDASQIRILGKGSAGLAALMATTLDDRVRSILISRTLATYVSVVDLEDYVLALDWFVPGILQHFDIPDITAAIYPRPVWMIDALDAEGAVLSESAVRECYSQRIPAASPALKGLRVKTTLEDDSEVYIDWLKHG